MSFTSPHTTWISAGALYNRVHSKPHPVSHEVERIYITKSLPYLLKNLL